jgi:hypothetical protein
MMLLTTADNLLEGAWDFTGSWNTATYRLTYISPQDTYICVRLYSTQFQTVITGQ